MDNQQLLKELQTLSKKIPTFDEENFSVTDNWAARAIFLLKLADFSLETTSILAHEKFYIYYEQFNLQDKFLHRIPYLRAMKSLIEMAIQKLKLDIDGK